VARVAKSLANHHLMEASSHCACSYLAHAADDRNPPPHQFNQRSTQDLHSRPHADMRVGLRSRDPEQATVVNWLLAVRDLVSANALSNIATRSRCVSWFSIVFTRTDAQRHRPLQSRVICATKPGRTATRTAFSAPVRLSSEFDMANGDTVPIHSRRLRPTTDRPQRLHGGVPTVPDRPADHLHVVIASSRGAGSARWAAVACCSRPLVPQGLRTRSSQRRSPHRSGSARIRSLHTDTYRPEADTRGTMS
jgi:hypothetical protein